MRTRIAILDRNHPPEVEVSWRIFHHRELAENLLRQDRFAEAELEARDTLIYSLKYSGKYSEHTANALRSLAKSIGAQGRAEEAETLLRAALDILAKSGVPGSSFSIASARNELAKALLAQGKWERAAEQFDMTREGMRVSNFLYKKWYANEIGIPIAMIKRGKTAQALAVIKRSVAEKRDRFGDKNIETAKARAVLAMGLAAKGDLQSALREFRAALPILTQRFQQSDSGGGGISEDWFTTMVLETFLALLRRLEAGGQTGSDGIDVIGEAFVVAELARNRTVQHALAASAARAAAGNSALADLARREQDALKHIQALYSVLVDVASAPSNERNPDTIQDLRVRIDSLGGARAALMEEIEARFPEYADLINPKPATIAEARAALRPGEALISTYVGEDRTFVWAIPHRGEVAFTSAPLGRERIAAVVQQLRQALEPNVATLGDIPVFDVALAHKLYQSLLAPVKAGWGGTRSVLVVAHGALGQLPFSLLVTEPKELGADREPLFANYREVPWLARSHAVTVLPSVASLATLRALPPGDPSRRAFAGFGDPWFSAAQAAEAELQASRATEIAGLASPAVETRGLQVRLRAAPDTDRLDSAELARLPRLPDTADEVRGIALALDADLTADVFLGAAANEGAVKTMDLSGVKVIAFATHGLVPGDLNGLTQPALALSSPEVAGGGGDGLLTMGEILALKLDADWVVLSACNTASGQGAGAEAVSGLGRAFFYAGTRALLVSNWPVETTSAKVLTIDIFRRQAANPGLGRAEALRRAMVALIDGRGRVDDAGRSVFSYAHPIFWAPFSLIGDGGGGTPTG